MNNIFNNWQTIWVTGGAGFIGSNCLNKWVLEYPNINFINIDVLSYASNLENLQVTNQKNYSFFKIDITDLNSLENLAKEKSPDAIIHLAAETHVDISITNPEIFVKTNVLGTYNLLTIAKKYNIKRFHHVSTDEVYGQLGKDGFFTEKTPLDPSSPYSASKAGSDLLVMSFNKTYNLNVSITRCSNNYGPYQDKTKLIPKFISLLKNKQKVPLYATGSNIRDWLYVEDHVDAIWQVATSSKSGSIYNVGGNNEKSNLEITKLLLENFNLDETYIEYVADRLGHDFRYAIDNTKIQTELNWKPKYSFEEGIKKTIEFYLKD